MTNLNIALNPAIVALQNEWQVIKANIKKDFKPACSFLWHALDVLIITAEQNLQNTPGEDKKTAVLAAFVVVFNTIIYPMMPMLLRPFSNSIQNFVINVVVAAAIDWAVSIYNKGGGVK